VQKAHDLFHEKDVAVLTISIDGISQVRCSQIFWMLCCRHLDRPLTQMQARHGMTFP
jgi:hypothetical protein